MLEKIYQYLYDRANKKEWNWATMLVNFVIEDNDKLNDNRTKQIFEYYLTEKWIKEWELNEIKPTLQNIQQENNLIINKISNVKGVNRLIWNQELELSNNLTVIYWENASWKTWYSRILKSLWKSYDKENLILWDLLDSNWDEKQYCEITIKDSNSQIKKFEWTWVWSVILPISLFNSSCVDIWIDNRELIFMPSWFSLFEIIKVELSKLLKFIEEQEDLIQRSFNAKIDFKNTLRSTKFQNIISLISYETDKQAIDDIVTESDEKLSTEKNTIEKNIKGLNRDYIMSQNEKFMEQLLELKELKKKIIKYKTEFSLKNRKKFVDLNVKLDELRKNPKLTISEIATKKWIQYYETEEFKNFIKNADLYLKKISKSNFKEWDVCPYCQQELSNDAVQLLESYQELLNNDTQKEIDEIQEEIKGIKLRINSLDEFEKFHYYPFWKDSKEQWIIPDEVMKVFWLKKEYINKINDINFVNDKIFVDCINTIELKELELNNKKGKNKKLISSIDEQEKKLKESLCEIEDKIIINTKKQILKEYIDDLVLYKKLQDCNSDFYWNDLSGLLKKVQKELLTDSFNDILTEEKKLLNCPNYIDLKLKVSDWKTAINQSIENYNLKNILSEWEQKSIAIAEFITELRVSNNNNPVIFDDPVNSLDHHRIWRVAKRLYNLAREKQVIIFTHNNILFNEFEQLNESYKKSKDGIDYVLYSVERQNWKCWMLNKDTPPSDESFQNYRWKINDLLSSSPKDISEAEIWKKWYSYLRSAIEILIEQGLFKNIIKRYRRNVATTNLRMIDWKLIDKNSADILDIYDRCCWYIEGHTSPEWWKNLPTLEELAEDSQKIFEIWKIFNSN